MRKKKTSDSGLIILAFVIGIPVFLMMEHPVIFWLVFVPSVTFGIIRFINWITDLSGRRKYKNTRSRNAEADKEVFL